MNSVDPKLQEVLAKLKDIKLPQDPSWWPPAPGRLVIILLIIITLIFLIKKTSNLLLKNYKQHLKKRALSELDNVLTEINNNNKLSVTHISTISLILKQCAIRKFQDKTIASLSGLAWLEFLDKNYINDNSHYFTSKDARNVNNLKYEKLMDSDRIQQETIDNVKTFILNSKSWITYNL